MNDIGVGAVGAAIIAGLVSLLGLIIGKEQKVSEFRQAWIDDLRKCLIGYLVNINAISDALRLRKSGTQIDSHSLLANYKALNEASHGIVLRVNAEEDPAKELLKSMSAFETIANANSTLTPDKIKSIEEDFVKVSKALLKFEWKRVKRGEKTFVWTKRVVAASIILMLGLMAYFWLTLDKGKSETTAAPGGVQVIQSVSEELSNASCGRKPYPRLDSVKAEVSQQVRSEILGAQRSERERERHCESGVQSSRDVKVRSASAVGESVEAKDIKR